MVGDIVIDGIHMDEDAKLILSDLNTSDEKRDFYLVYFRMRPTIQAEVEMEAQLKKGREEIENIHNECVGDQRVDVVGRKKRKNIVWKKKGGGVPCDQGHCHKTFDNKWNMKRHLEAETKIKCGHCNKGLMGKRNYQNHLKRQHEKFLKKLKCETCDREFAGEKSLNKHIKQHDPNIADGEF